jgi:hypothetical protein
MQAYENLFGGSKGRVDLGAPSTTPTTGTSPIVSTTGVNVGTPGTATAPKPVPLPGVPGATFTPGQPQFFGNVPGSMLPGTLPSNINPMQSYKGPMVGQMLANNPNLSPTVLGGAQGLGYYTDRLGNRILSPGGALMRFAEGGEADKDDSAKAELEKLLASMPAQEKTEVRVSPNARSVKRTTTKSAATDRGKAMSMSLESLAAGKGSGTTDQGSASEQLAALMEEVKGKKEDVSNLARKNLTRSTLDRAGPLAVRRFAEGGESKSAARQKLDELVEMAGRGARKAKRGAAELLGVADIPQRAERESVAAYGIKESGGGKADAMRHLMYQADLTRKFNPMTASAISKLYELSSPGQTDAEEAMDKFNDALGREIGQQAKDEQDVVRLAREYVDKNKARILPKEERTGYKRGGSVRKKRK